MLFHEVRLWCRAIQNANLLQKVHTVRNQISQIHLICIWPPASPHNLKETPALPKRIAFLLRKTMTPLVCFTNPILQLHPSIANICHSLRGLGRILVVRSCIRGSAGTLFGGHGKQRTDYLLLSWRLRWHKISQRFAYLISFHSCSISCLLKSLHLVSGSLTEFRDIQNQWLWHHS